VPYIYSFLVLTCYYSTGLRSWLCLAIDELSNLSREHNTYSILQMIAMIEMRSPVDRGDDDNRCRCFQKSTFHLCSEKAWGKVRNISKVAKKRRLLEFKFIRDTGKDTGDCSLHQGIFGLDLASLQVKFELWLIKASPRRVYI
jgi:hypothetical protein